MKVGRRVVKVGSAVLLLASLGACKKDEAAPDRATAASDGTQGSKCSGDGDCKNGLLCESNACLPADRVKQLRAATTPAAAQPTAQAHAPGTRPDDLTGVGGHSKVPTTDEWSSVGEITVRHSGPLGCETKMVREWLRVSCRGNHVSGISVQSTTGMSKGEVFTFSRGDVASAVLPVRPGYSATIEYTWTGWGTRTLTMRFPSGSPRPTIEFDRPAPK